MSEAGITAILSYKSQQASRKNSTEIAGVKGDVKTIELATNSMKDALVEATRGEALLEGADNERLAERLRNAAIKEAEDKGSVEDPLHVKLTEEETE